MGSVLGVVFGEPGVLAFVLVAILVAILSAFMIWAWVIKKRVGPPPPDRPGHETERFHFKYGAEPPGPD
jgi:uncharacterized iron-regulated membrane protein